MKKIISISVVLLFMTISTISFASADETLTGDIDVEINEWMGIVYPQINLENQSVTFDAELTDSGENEYLVNDTLIINLDITNNSDRNFLFPRSIYYSVIMSRKISDVKLLPFRGYLNRLFPVRSLFNTVNVIGGLVGKNASNTIEIPISYTIDEETFNNGENITLHLSVMGFLPGDLNGLGQKVPIVSNEKIVLDIEYS